ncbi:MAG: hypothetical protein V7700_10235 [Halioglobus sp.]
MRCVLHIGTEKTGSTAIQQYLYANREELRKVGVCKSLSAGNINNRALPAAFIPDNMADDFLKARELVSLQQRHNWKAQFLRDFTAEIRSASEWADVFVISSEHFHSRLLHIDKVTALHEFLAPLCDDITIICYLRRQDQMALSLYSQVLRAGYVPQTILPTQWTEEQDIYFDFERLLDRWAQGFGENNCVPRIYSRTDLVNGDVVADFLQTAAICISPIATTAKSNPALSAAAQAALLQVNARLQNDDSATTRSLRAKFVKYLEEISAGAGALPTRAEASTFYSAFKPSNNAVARRWFGRDELFDSGFLEYPETADNHAIEEGVDLWEQFISQEGGDTQQR